MAITLTVRVVDANLGAVPGALVVLDGGQGTTDAAGRWSTVVSHQPTVPQIRVSHPAYVAERVTFTGDLRSATWDNSLARRAVSGDDVTMTVTLGRMDPSPVVTLSDADVTRIMASRGRDPRAARVVGWPNNPRIHTYAGHYNNTLTFRQANRELLKPAAAAESDAGWDRFGEKREVTVNIAALSRFHFLEYAATQSDPKFVVAVVSPNLPDPKPVTSLDFVVYCSPSTGDYTARYPYGLVNAAAPLQEYLNLARKYLLDEAFFAFQSLGWGNRSVLVMPLFPQGQWGPFATGEGLLRMLREVAVFLHRQCRTSSLGLRKPDATAHELAGPNLRTIFPPLYSGDFGTVPGVGQVAVAGFSQGIGAVKALMSDLTFPVGLNSTLWGVPMGGGTDGRREWARAFREVWDLDGHHSGTGGWRAYLDLLRVWFNHDPGRVVRSYHSGDTGPPDPLTDPHPVWTDLHGAGLDLDRPTPPARGAFWARLLQNARWTDLRVSNPYVDGSSGPQLPVFLDPHHTMPRIGFSHALSMTTLGRAAATRP
ncbi:hypothetical protein [Micromonospora sp. NPDC007220]|uniref:hypothetical protein n=1 Tax=Micromonospora sp. NPDC007220 TaxID=3154318 RepID=UPI00340020FD